MPYIPPEVVAQAREMDLLTYLRTYEPQELVHFGGGTYCTREHDSLKISNGKWCWFSRGIGGYSALDYLIKVKEMLATKGHPKRRSAGVHQVILSHIEEHSKKPEEARRRIVELMGDLPRIELFARQKADGWDAWGNEVACDVALTGGEPNVG